MRTEDDANQDLKPLFEIVFDSVTEGVRDYFRDHPSVNHKHTISSRRMVTRDYIVDRLRATMGSLKGIYVTDKNQTTNFGIQSRYLGRVHKLCGRVSAAIGHTQASMAFQDNDAERALGPDFDKVTCIRIGYMPIAAAPRDPRIFITCPIGRKNAWQIELKRAEGAAVTIEPMTGPSDDSDDMVEIIGEPAVKGDDE